MSAPNPLALLRSALRKPASLARSVLPEGTDLHRAILGRWDLGGPADGLVQVLALEHPGTTELFSGCGERTVGGQRLAVAHPDRRRGGSRCQTSSGLQDAGLTDLSREGCVFLSCLLV